MRTKEQFNRDTYILDLIKEVSVFTMMAYSFFNEAMMTQFGPIFAIMAVAFMFIPRAFINDLFDKNGNNETRTFIIPNWIRTFNRVLSMIKFACLIVLTSYIFLNQEMMEIGGMSILWIVSSFMIIPRRLINMILKDTHDFETSNY